MLKDNEYMPLLDAAQAMGITRQWLRKLVKAGKAPTHVQVGNRTIFERASVEEFAQREVAGQVGRK